MHHRNRNRIGLCAAVAAGLLATTGASAAPDESAGAEATLSGQRVPTPDELGVDIDALLAEAEAGFPSTLPPEPEAESDPTLALGDAFERARDRVVAGDAWAIKRLRAARNAVFERLPAPARRGADAAVAAAMNPDGQIALLQLAVAGLVALLTLRLLRGRGDVAVTFEYPAELRGSFRVRLLRGLARKRTQPLRPPSPREAAERRNSAGAATRTKHPLVSRETRFRDFASGPYHVVIDGFIEDPESGEVLTTHREERDVRIRRGQTVRLAFEYHPRECPVELRVVWHRRPVTDALVGLRGVPGAPRYARGGPVRIGVGLGHHVLMIGSGDRVAEVPVEISSFRAVNLEIDLANRDHLLFTGCPPAVEPYLHGDISSAARALDREGQTEVGETLLARVAVDRHQPEAAARHYEAAERFVEAAELRETLSHFTHAADLYEKAGDPARAAEMHRHAGDPRSAGDAFVRAADYASAADCFRDAREVGRWIDALEKNGQHFDAASVALEHGQQARAVRCLQEVPLADPRYLSAARLLAEVYQEQGHLDLAERKIEEILAAQGEEHTPIELCDRLSQLLENEGEYDRALDLLEVIRRRSKTYPNLDTRIEELRKRRSRDRGVTDSDGSTAHTAFSEDRRYEMVEEIGRGGMGVVWKARDRRLGREVALKRLPENLRNHPKAVELFLREARAAAALNHPNIVTLFDAGHEGDAYYITMELLEGKPLTAILRANGRLSPRDAAKLGVRIAAGLQYAHDQRIVHRDIKTANLFLTNNKTLKIMDFGLAKMMEEVRRATTVIGGTPYYMAPEQSEGGAVDHRADLYAMGVTLFELVTGELPFADGDVAYHHRHTPPPDPRELVPELPDDFAELLFALLAKKPEDRVASAAEAGERLQAISRGSG